jgi:hypothetical protein
MACQASIASALRTVTPHTSGSTFGISWLSVGAASPCRASTACTQRNPACQSPAMVLQGWYRCGERRASAHSKAVASRLWAVLQTCH